MSSDSNENLLKQAQQLYRNVRRSYEAAAYDRDYSLNELWGSSNMRAMLEILNDSANALEAIHRVQRTQLFSVNSADGIRGKAVDWLLERQRLEGLDLFALPEKIGESEFSCPDNNVMVGGRPLTADFIRTISIASEIARRCPALPKPGATVVELGGGCGHLARTLRLMHATKTHVIVDLPESLCFSYMFLRLNFPDAKVLYATDAADLRDRDIAEFSFVFVPTMLADLLAGKPFDLFVNTASLGEMRNEHIRYWMRFVQERLKVRYLYCLNRYLNTIIFGKHDWRLEENECSVHYDASWTVSHWELEPPFTRCPYSDTVIARYLQVVAERRTPQDRSQSLLDAVRQQDWVRLEHSHPPEMTYRDNILVNDMTMSGTLFKLWESIRLKPQSSAVELMLKYLETLLHRSDREFEETFYYENRLRELCVLEGRAYPQWIRQRQEARLASLPPRLLQDDYRGFNLVQYRGMVYALDRDWGPIDIRAVRPEELGRRIAADSLEGARRCVDAAISEGRRFTRDLQRSSIQ